jgi:protein-tyrosine phosphatase
MAPDTLVPSGQVTEANPHDLEQVFNLRDLGGHQGRGGQTVRHGRCLRADGLHRATAGDRVRLDALGVRTVVDLRTASEVAAGRFEVGGTSCTWHHRPLLARTWAEAGHVGEPPDGAAAFLTARYVEMLDEGRDAIAGLFALLASPARHPLVFHCAAGKDRTGVVAALLLGVLGVRDEHIVADYVRSGPAVERAQRWYLRTRPGGETSATVPAAHLATEPAAVLAVLESVRRDHGSVLGYLRAIGIPFETIEAVHTHLLA